MSGRLAGRRLGRAAPPDQFREFDGGRVDAVARPDHGQVRDLLHERAAGAGRAALEDDALFIN